MGEHASVALEIIGRQAYLAVGAGMTVEGHEAKLFAERTVA